MAMHAHTLPALARVLLVDNKMASRLTLQTVLQAAGYAVTATGTSDEAIEQLNRDRFELVLSELNLDVPQGGLEVLAYARMMEYEPATAMLSAMWESTGRAQESRQELLIEDTPGLIDQVAQFISERANRNIERLVSGACVN